MVHAVTSRLLREPLLHFLLLGAGIFLVYDRFHTDAGADSQTIVVDRDKLLTHLQFRSRAFDAGSASRAFR